MSISIFNAKSNLWRESYNPLRGMSLPRLGSLLEAGERGQYADLQWFYHYMERSDAMIYAVMQRRRAALLDSDWSIRKVAEPGPVAPAAAAPVPGAPPATPPQPAAALDDTLAAEQAAFLTEVYDGIENFRDALAFLYTALFRGFAHLEKHYAEDGTIQRLETVEQWFWGRDGMFGDWEYNENAVSGRRRGLPIERENFVIFEAVAMNRMLAQLYLRRALNIRGWDSFLEVFGVPSVFLIGPPNTPESKESEYQIIAENLISDGRGYLPNGSDIKYVNGGGGQGAPFLQHMEYIDRQITLIGTGGLLTMLAESGSGTLAGNAHQSTFLQIARGDAAALSEVFQRDIDVPLLRQAFPGQPVQAYFQFTPAVPDEGSKVIQDAAALAGVGYVMDRAELSERTGYTLQA